MINLLPLETKNNIRHARRNSVLMKWLIASIVTAAGLSVFMFIGNLYIADSVASYTTQVEKSREDLRLQNLGQVEQEIQTIGSDIKLVVQVLSKEVLFSKLLRQIGAAMPDKTILSDIEISKVEGSIDLAARARDYQSATQIQLNLQDPTNKIFEKADIESIDCAEASSEGDELAAVYPCQISIRALFGNNTSLYMFITQGQETQP